MPNNFLTRVLLCALVIIFSGTIFLISSKFNNVTNGIKNYFLITSLLLFFFVVNICKIQVHNIKSALTGDFFYALFCVGSIECLYVVAQFLIIIKNGFHTMLPSGLYENPAGVITHLALLYPLGLFRALTTRGCKKIIAIIQLLLYVFVIFVCKSRTGLIAIIISTVTYFIISSNCFRKRLSNIYVIFGLVIALFIFCLYVYRWKIDSTNGRILIWKVCLNMIKEKPILGYGFDGFTSNYMLSQADFFLNNPKSKYALLADNTSNPLNFYVHVAVVSGAVGLLCVAGVLFFLFYRVNRLKDSNKVVWYSIIASLLTMGMFTYPFHYASVWFITFFLVLYPLYDILPSKIQIWTRIVFAVLIGCCLYCVNNMALNDIRWKHVQDKSFNEGKTLLMLKYYKRLYPQLRYNKHFLYNYGAELNYCGYYAESKQIMDECCLKLNDYNVQLIQADNYYNIGDTLSAIKSYQLAKNMIPCRFIPLEGLLDIYLSQQHNDEAKAIAKEIVSKPIKIRSSIVEDIVNKAKGVLQ